MKRLFRSVFDWLFGVADRPPSVPCPVCPACRGSGRWESVPFAPDFGPCPACRGSGRFDGEGVSER